MAKYRVRDEAVDEGGSELECPECRIHFLVHPPSRGELGALIENLTHENERLETKVINLERRLAAEQQNLEQAHHDLETLGANRVHLEQELQHAARRLEALTPELERLRTSGTQKDAALADFQRVLALRDTATESLRAELSFAREHVKNGTAGAALDPALVATLSSISPMLWVLTQTINDVERQSATEPDAQARLQPLRLLHAMLERLIQDHGPA